MGEAYSDARPGSSRQVGRRRLLCDPGAAPGEGGSLTDEAMPGRPSRRAGVPEERSKIEAVAEYHLHNHMVGAGGHPEADAEIELPLRGEVEVDGGEDLVLLAL